MIDARFLLAAGITLSWLGYGSAATAEPAKPSASPTPAPGCVLSAKMPVRAKTALRSEPKGGTVVAEFTGGEIAFSLSHFSTSDKKARRVRVRTSAGSPEVRLEGWSDLDAFPLYAARDLAAVGNQLWISKSIQLTLVGSSGKELEVAYKILGSDQQWLRKKVPCDAVTLQPPSVEASEIPKRARTYQMKKGAIELYDAPNGDVVYTLRMDGEARKPFWSSESRGGFVHVITRGDVTIDAWARWRDLEPLRRGEVFDQSVPRPSPRRAKKLAMQDPPASVKAPADLPIHAQAKNAAEPIGWVEAGASFYPMERAHGWTNIVPTTLGVLPPDGAGFWVRSSGFEKKTQSEPPAAR
jgi:hypothetical protein